MENKVQISQTKAGKNTSKNAAKHVSVRIKASSKKVAKALRDEANQKSAGRAIMMDEIFELALSLVTKEKLKLLQERSLTNEDRMEILRQRYIETRGPISKDQWLGFVMTAEFSVFQGEQNAGTTHDGSTGDGVAKAG